jgi:hypothetical protein
MGPTFVEKQPEEEKAFWNNKDVTWDELTKKVTEKTTEDLMSVYCLSKAAVNSLTMI